MKKLNKGFTLIELLVVIAIIGILAAVVLVNVNSARNRARSASVQSQLSQLRTAMELNGYTSSTNTYVNPLTSSEPAISSIRTTLDNNAEGAIKERVRGNSGGAAGTWFMAARTRNQNNNADWYCVDSTGASKFIGATAPGNTITSCP